MEEILRRTNSVLFRSTSEGQFVTIVIVHVDPRSRTLTFANAGHPLGYVFSAAGQLKFSLDSLSMPLALDLDTDFPVSGPILIESGDLIVLVTDGVLEARSGGGAFFGVHRTLQVVRDQVHTPTETILRSVHSATHDFTGTEAPQDDETIVLIKIR